MKFIIFSSLTFLISFQEKKDSIEIWGDNKSYWLMEAKNST